MASPYVTKIAFFSAVVVEGSHDKSHLSADVHELLESLGDTVIGDNELSSNTYEFGDDQDRSHRGPNTFDSEREFTDYKALADLIDELISTERSYVTRLRILKNSYADPLRSYARNKNTAIISAYDAKILFGNIDFIIPVNQAFLHDLESISKDDQQEARHIGDIALKHFKDLRGFECYKQYYAKREEAQAIFKREMNKNSSTGFAGFVDRIKYSSADAKTRVGLRELLMDPVQRIPRYTLMFRSIIKVMDSGHPQRAKLIEADEIARKIALAETDVDTKRAAIMYSLAATIDEFPPALISNNRRFIDCIDVADTLIENTSLTTATSSSINSAVTAFGTLHCTIFLFDDKLLITKRPAEKSGRTLAGLDDLDKLTNAGALSRGSFKKGGLICKGVVDLVDVIAVDINRADLHIYLENPPKDQSERWSYRPSRDLTVVHPASFHQDISQIQHEKKLFLENLWNAQALYRTKLGQSVVLCTGDKELEARFGNVTIARTFFNIYERTSFLRESKKAKIVVHIDPSGCADPIPFGFQSPPFVVARVQPMAGELCRYTVSTNNPDDEEEEDIVQTSRIPAKIIHTIYQLDLFKLKFINHNPTDTHTTSIRPRAHIFGLETISRNLFGIKQNSLKGEPVRGKYMTEQHKRSKSMISRASSRTNTTATTSDSLMKFSCSSLSSDVTSLTDDEESRSIGRSHKLFKRRRSPYHHSSNEVVAESARFGISRPKSDEFRLDYSGETEGIPSYSKYLSDSRILSDQDSATKLEVARIGSRSQKAEKEELKTCVNEINGVYYKDKPPIVIRAKSQIKNTSTAHVCEFSGSGASFSLHRNCLTEEVLQNTELPVPHRNISSTRFGSCTSASPKIFQDRQAIEPSGTLTHSSEDNKNFTVEPLSIKKKVSVHVKSMKNEDDIPVKTISNDPYCDEHQPVSTLLNKLLLMAHTTKEHLNAVSRALKQINLSLDEQPSKGQQMDEEEEMKVGPTRSTSPPVHVIQTTKEKDERMLETQAYSCSRRHLSDIRYKDVITIDDRIEKAICNEDSLIVLLEQVISDAMKEKSSLKDATTGLLKLRRQCELMKDLLSDATTENEILYESFNEELDGMFNDVSLPKDEAWVAITEDLRRTKESRNNLIKENIRLKRRLEEVISERDQWSGVIRNEG